MVENQRLPIGEAVIVRLSMLVYRNGKLRNQRQEVVYYALFKGVTEAKALVDKVALICRGHGMFT